MARKRGFLGILILILLYFASGAIILYLTNIVANKIPDFIPDSLKQYIVAGISAVIGFLYRFVVFRFGSKSLKKLMFG